MDKYLELYNTMKYDMFYRAKDLEVAPATMTAMVRRGLVEDLGGSPKTYLKAKVSKLNTIANIVGFSSMFSLYPQEGIGMLCTFSKGRILDAWGQPYDVKEAVKIRVGKKEYSLT